MVVEQYLSPPGLGHQEHAGPGQVVAVKEFAAWSTRTPNSKRPVAPHPGLMRLPDQGGQDVAVLQVVIIARTVKIRGHDRQIPCAVLTVVRPAHLDARDLGQGIGSVRGLQGAGQQIGFSDGLRTFARIDAA